MTASAQGSFEAFEARAVRAPPLELKPGEYRFRVDGDTFGVVVCPPQPGDVLLQTVPIGPVGHTIGHMQVFGPPRLSLQLMVRAASRVRRRLNETDIDHLETLKRWLASGEGDVAFAMVAAARLSAKLWKLDGDRRLAEHDATAQQRKGRMGGEKRSANAQEWRGIARQVIKNNLRLSHKELMSLIEDALKRSGVKRPSAGTIGNLITSERRATE